MWYFDTYFKYFIQTSMYFEHHCILVHKSDWTRQFNVSEECDDIYNFTRNQHFHVLN